MNLRKGPSTSFGLITQLNRGDAVTVLTIPATVLWGLLILLFTLWPPQGPLFDDLSLAMARLFMTC